jgi:transcriptional regulator with XRE-family HTH domain
MTLQQYLNQLGWTIADLSREARINYGTAAKAVNGERVAARIAREIAEALSRELGRTIRPGDIEGLKF